MKSILLSISLFTCFNCLAADPVKVIPLEPYVVDLLDHGYTKFDTRNNRCNLDLKSSNSSYCSVIKFKCETTSKPITKPNLFNIKYEKNKRYYQFSKFGEIVKTGLIGPSYNKDLISIEEIYIDGYSSSNLRSSFEFKNDGLYVLPKLNISEEMLRSSEIRIVGTCEEATFEKKLEYPVHSKPVQESSQLGVIQVSVKPTESKPWISIKFNDQYFDSPEPVLPNYYCDIADGNFIYLFALNTDGEWSDLGKGPWGQSGWVKVQATKLFDTQLTFYHEEHEHMKFNYIGDGKVQTVSDAYETKIIPLSEVYEEGKLKVQIDCNKGC